MILKPSRLAYYLNLELNELEMLISELEKYYYEKKELKRNDDGSTKYKNSKPQYRVFHPSKGILKNVQKRIKNKILNKIDLPSFIHGGVHNKDNISNAKVHQGKKYNFRTDLSNFFPSINHRMVYKMFIDNSFSPDVSRLLTKLTTYKGVVPQGIPTSTHIANLVFLPVDIKIKNFCRENRIIYTRFVDDLSFSSQKDFKNQTSGILKIIDENQFRVNHSKTFYKVGPTLTTGVISKNNNLKPRNEQIARLRDGNLTQIQEQGLKNYIIRVENY